MMWVLELGTKTCQHCHSLAIVDVKGLIPQRKAPLSTPWSLSLLAVVSDPTNKVTRNRAQMQGWIGLQHLLRLDGAHRTEGHKEFGWLF